jgi:hypothetical protein
MLARALKLILPLPLCLLLWAMVVRGWAALLLADPSADFAGWLVGAAVGVVVGLGLTVLCGAPGRSPRSAVGVLLLLALCCAALSDALSQLLRAAIPGALAAITLVCVGASVTVGYAVRRV